MAWVAETLRSNITPGWNPRTQHQVMVGMRSAREKGPSHLSHTGPEPQIRSTKTCSPRNLPDLRSAMFGLQGCSLTTSAAVAKTTITTGIHMSTLGLCHVPRVAGIHYIICRSRPLFQAQSSVLFELLESVKQQQQQ